jgi:hypothetical protein
VFIGTKKPETAPGAAAQEPEIEGPKGKLAKEGKLAKKGAKESVGAVAAKESTGEGPPAAKTATAKPKPKPKKTVAESADGAISPAKPARAAKPAAASPSVAGTN